MTQQKLEQKARQIREKHLRQVKFNSYTSKLINDAIREALNTKI